MGIIMYIICIHHSPAYITIIYDGYVTTHSFHIIIIKVAYTPRIYDNPCSVQFCLEARFHLDPILSVYSM